MVLVTGAAGQVGAALADHLRSAGYDVIATDLSGTSVPCDLRSDGDVARLFDRHRYSTVVHLAGVLPTAFRRDPLAGGELNLSATLRLLRACVHSGVRRFVFASSTSVYGSGARTGCSEAAELMPDDPYAAAKLAIERILELAPAVYSIQAVSLRVARVLGPGARKTSSIWRSQIFERPDDPASNCITIPFAPGAILSVLHVEDLARMFRVLIDAPALPSATYNTPVELLSAAGLAQLAEETRGWRVSMGSAGGGPQIDGTRFACDFGFVMRPLSEHMLESM